MTRSDTLVPSVSVALLLAVLGSVVPSGAVTVAVLVRKPVVEDATVPLTVKVTELPAPAGILTVALRLLPEPLAPLGTEAVPVWVDVHVTPVRAVGMVSATVALTASLGPLLVTVMV